MYEILLNEVIMTKFTLAGSGSSLCAGVVCKDSFGPLICMGVCVF